MEVVGVALVALLTAVAGTAVFVMVVIGIHASERQAGLPGPARGHADALARRMDELESVLAAGRLGYCHISLASRELRANSQFKAEFGWPPDAPISWQELLERIQREDRTKLADAIEAAFNKLGKRLEVSIV